MTMEGIGLFNGVEAKMKYVSRSQALVSQNIANADTPNYQPRELSEVDFTKLMDKALEGDRKIRKLTPAITSGAHMTGYGNASNPRLKDQRFTYEIAPAGNAVILEEQMIQANKNLMDHSVLARVLNKNVGMIKKAIGSSGQ